MEKKQSSVEWLVEQYENQHNQHTFTRKDWLNLIQQAEEMHEKQTKEAYEQGCEMGEMFNNENRCFKTDAQQYYNETYKQ